MIVACIGENSKTVTFSLKGSDLAFVGYDGHWILEKGAFRLQAGNQTLQIECTRTDKDCRM